MDAQPAAAALVSLRVMQSAISKALDTPPTTTQLQRISAQLELLAPHLITLPEVELTAASVKSWLSAHVRMEHGSEDYTLASSASTEAAAR